MNLTFSLIQTSLYWENKAANLQMLEDKINSIKEATNIVVLPEMFTTGFSMNPEVFAEKIDGQSIEWMRKIATHKKIILTGSLMIEEEGQYFNRLIWMLPNGEFYHYNKRHLFALGEENKHYTGGDKRIIVSANKWKINLQICYDLRFPVWARQAASNLEEIEDIESKYDILLYVANWPERRIHAWKTLLMARAIENQCYVIGVNRVGNDGNNIYHNGCSCVIDPLGEILYQKENDEDIFTITLNKNEIDNVRKTFPFWKDADGFFIH